MTSVTWLSGNRGALGWTLTTSWQESVCNHVAREGCGCNRALLCTTNCSWFKRTQMKLWQVWSDAKWFLQRRVLRLRYCGTWHRVIWWTGIKVSEETQIQNVRGPSTLKMKAANHYETLVHVHQTETSQKIVKLKQNASQRLWAMAIWPVSGRLNFAWRHIKVFKILFVKHSEQ